jgi:nucleotide-binding universal stress UspA family protein
MTELSNADAHKVPRIVVGVDGSPQSMRALAWAAQEAKVRGIALEIVHVDFFREEALAALAPGLLSNEHLVLSRAVERAKELAPGVVVIATLRDPPAGPALIEVSTGAEMLVVGSRGLSGFKELSLGSVSHECAQHAHCPVVILRPQPDSDQRASHGLRDDVATASGRSS